MVKNQSLTRRQVVSLTTTGITLSIAGCSALSSVGSDDSEDASSPSDTEPATDQHDAGGATDGHDAGGTDEHDDGLPPATETTTIRMLTTGSITDVFTGDIGPVSFVTDDRTHFEPHVAHIEIGGTVTWTAESGDHGVAAYHSMNNRQRRIPADATPWNSGPLEAGESFSHTFTVEGVYDYYCPPHEGMGMIGCIVVGPPSVEDQPGLQSPAEMPTSKAETKIEELNQRVTQALVNGSEGTDEDGHGSESNGTEPDSNTTTSESDDHDSDSDDHDDGGGH